MQTDEIMIYERGFHEEGLFFARNPPHGSTRQLHRIHQMQRFCEEGLTKPPFILLRFNISAVSVLTYRMYTKVCKKEK